MELIEANNIKNGDFIKFNEVSEDRWFIVLGRQAYKLENDGLIIDLDEPDFIPTNIIRIEKATNQVSEIVISRFLRGTYAESMLRLQEDLRGLRLKIYKVEHTPNGKLFDFISYEDIEVNDLVICNTRNGLVYGVVKEIEIKYIIDDRTTINQYKKIKKVNG